MAKRLSTWARAIKTEAHALYLAARDPRTPWYAKALAALVAAYALSPVDLIPDFIPLLGLLDDVLIVPLGVWVVVKMIPPNVIAESRATAARAAERPASRAAAAWIVLIWIASAGFCGWLAYRYFAAGAPE